MTLCEKQTESLVMVYTNIAIIIIIIISLQVYICVYYIIVLFSTWSHGIYVPGCTF